jgi:hypothetical protein
LKSSELLQLHNSFSFFKNIVSFRFENETLKKDEKLERNKVGGWKLNLVQGTARQCPIFN